MSRTNLKACIESVGSNDSSQPVAYRNISSVVNKRSLPYNLLDQYNPKEFAVGIPQLRTLFKINQTNPQTGQYFNNPSGPFSEITYDADAKQLLIYTDMYLHFLNGDTGKKIRLLFRK